MFTYLYARDMHSNRRFSVGSMLRLPELSGPNVYVWHHVLFTVSKSYPGPLFRRRGVESLWGDDTMKCPLWMTWVRIKDLTLHGPVAPTPGSCSSPSVSESDSESGSWFWWVGPDMSGDVLLAIAIFLSIYK